MNRSVKDNSKEIKTVWGMRGKKSKGWDRVVRIMLKKGIEASH